MSGGVPAAARIALRKARSAGIRLRALFAPDPEAHLRRARGVIHVGANTGQEREVYARLGLKVLWIEPIPAVFDLLKARIAPFPRQRSVCALISDRDDQPVAFHVASNGGASSSMLDLKLHRDLWPDIVYQETLALHTVTLPTLLGREGLDPRSYDALVLDTQGAELMVLRGAASLLQGFDSIQVEVADFEAYTGCCQLVDLRAFLLPMGFREKRLRAFGEHPGGGRYHEMVYVRGPPRRASATGREA